MVLTMKGIEFLNGFQFSDAKWLTSIVRFVINIEKVQDIRLLSF